MAVSDSDKSAGVALKIESTRNERPLMLAYWGGSGGLPKLTLDLARHAAAQDSIHCTFSLSNSNELIEDYAFLGDGLFAIQTFKSKWRVLVDSKSVIDLRIRLSEQFRRHNTKAFVSLMSHVWSPLVAPVIRKAGVRHVVVVHDADPHPGDRYALVNRWLLREATGADHVITLSKFVAQRLTAAHGISARKISTLFHPDLDYSALGSAKDDKHDALRILFMGRLLPYKGLGLLVDAVESLRGQGILLELGVYGRGEIEPRTSQKLSELSAKVMNNWISHKDLAQVLAAYDVVAAPHTEASQSGVVSAAFGAGVPVIATPVGGLVEQVTPGVTGIIAEAATSDALARAIRMLAEDRGLLIGLRNGIKATRGSRSIERFFDEICKIALEQPDGLAGSAA
jgi:glycosyltransferase involved in cell wall biosynthesis